MDTKQDILLVPTVAFEMVQTIILLAQMEAISILKVQLILDIPTTFFWAAEDTDDNGGDGNKE